MTPMPPAVPLSALVGRPRLARDRRGADPLVRGLAYDSRRVVPGDLFVCLRGAQDDGHRHAADAARRGAVAIVGERPVEGLDGLPQLTVADSRAELAQLAARFYGEPSASLHLTGVTGTEGKTTTVYLLDAVLRGGGRTTGMFGTIVNRVGPRAEPAALTTPESLELKRLLWECIQARVSHVVMEVSSHALAQGRVAGCEFDQAVFTNLHSDHLDFHGTPERYRAAKAALFAGLGRGPAKVGAGQGFVNDDDPFASYMRMVCPRPVVRFGTRRSAQVRGWLLAAELGRTALRATTPDGEVTVTLRLTGPFNAVSALGAIAAGRAMGVDLATIKGALEEMPGVPGRFEVVPNGLGLLVVVDFAHTQAAFAEILPFLRRLTPGRILAVFGCAGDRDRRKRPTIGRFVVSRSDVAIITTDNPASEDPADIVEEILRGVREVDPGGDRHLVVLDRTEAVRTAVALARSGDAILLAGKGHEECQLARGTRMPYSDRVVVEEALRRREGAGRASP